MLDQGRSKNRDHTPDSGGNEAADRQKKSMPPQLKQQSSAYEQSPFNNMDSFMGTEGQGQPGKADYVLPQFLPHSNDDTNRNRVSDGTPLMYGGDVSRDEDPNFNMQRTNTNQLGIRG